MRSDVVVAGVGWLPVQSGVELQLDELVFSATSAALRDAGLRRHEIDLTVLTSLDLYDGRSISNALTAPAAAGYLSEELRVEGDVSTALLFAAESIRAGQAEVAHVVAISVPEIGSTDESSLWQLSELVSSYTFDSHLDRPVGVTTTSNLAMHAARCVDTGRVTIREMAKQTARDLALADRSRGASRPVLGLEEVLSAPTVASPLTIPMLPAQTAAVGSMIITSEPRGRRVPRARGRLTGWSTCTSGSLAAGGWLDQPALSTSTATARALSAAGLERFDEALVAVSMTDMTPALTKPILAALAVPGDYPSERVNQFGGVRANYPGLANGMLRLLEALDVLADNRSQKEPAKALVHSVDSLAGLMSATSSVFVVEQM